MLRGSECRGLAVATHQANLHYAQRCELLVSAIVSTPHSRAHGAGPTWHLSELKSRFLWMVVSGTVVRNMVLGQKPTRNGGGIRSKLINAGIVTPITDFAKQAGRS
jgi:hypothetical protein